MYCQPPLGDAVLENRIRDVEVRGHLFRDRAVVQRLPVECEPVFEFVALAQFDVVDTLGSGHAVEDENLLERLLDAVL